MAEKTASSGWLVPMSALFAATFCVGTSELIVLALLPNLAADLGVDIPTTGLLITGYAAGVAVASPVLTLFTGNVPRRLLLLAMLGAFIVGNVLCAIAPVYWMLLCARLVVACCHGVLLGTSMVLATRIAPEGRQTTAVSMVISGFTLATILGVPIGTAIGHAFGWRATFWLIAVVGGLAAVIVAVLIPQNSEQNVRKVTLAAELRAATRPIVLTSYAAIILFMMGVFTLYTYLIPLMTTVSGVPLDYVPWVLFGMGFVGFFGNLASGRLADWRPYTTMFGILGGLLVLLFAMAQVVSSTWAFLAVLWLMWFIGFGYAAPVRTRILKAVADAPNFASTLTSTAFNIGIAGGAAIGGSVIAAGWGYGALPLVDAVFTGLALLATVALWALERRLRAVPAAA